MGTDLVWTSQHVLELLYFLSFLSFMDFPSLCIFWVLASWKYGAYSEMLAYQYHVLAYVVSRENDVQWWILTIYTHITVFCSLACYFWTIIDGAAEEAFSVIIYVRLINSIAEQNFQKDYFDWLKYGHIYRVLSFLLLLHLTTCEAEAEPMCFSRRNWGTSIKRQPTCYWH